MCGVAGVLDLGGGSRDLGQWVAEMTATIVHRGPDGSGAWVDEEAGVALGHRRLSIIDLSPSGDQPMVSPSGRYVVSYNGEIYGYRRLRDLLAGRGVRFRGTSDTEVLLAAVDTWGLPGALTRLDGMFAFACWDRSDRVLHLVRDRLGEKPLYYGVVGGRFVVASELRAIRAVPGAPSDPDPVAMAELLRRGYVPDPLSILSGISKLPAGAHLVVRRDTARAPRLRQWWTPPDGRPREARGPSFAEAVDRTESLLTASIADRLVADVPVGAFLSGGIDSSLVVALAQRVSTETVRTFTVAFDDAAYDESDSAATVATHLGTAHTTLRLAASDALALVPEALRGADEPFADPSLVPTMLLCAEVREHVTVALTGDGGDEVFGGYNRYVLGDALWRRSRRVPRPLRHPLGALLGAVPVRAFDAAGRAVGRVFGRFAVRNPGDKAHKLGRALDAADVTELYERLAWPWPGQVPLARVPAARTAAVMAHPLVTAEGASDAVDVMMQRDLIEYLPGDALVKVDRAAMRASLETRLPLLDHRLVEYAWTLPRGHHVGGGQGKRILRALLARHVPSALWDRPKMGFDPPLDEWLRGPLRPWADALLDPARLRREGWFDERAITATWRSHLRGRTNEVYRLWPILAFQAWSEAR